MTDLDQWVQDNLDVSTCFSDNTHRWEFTQALRALLAQERREAVTATAAVIVGTQESGGSIGIYQQTQGRYERRLADGTTPMAHYGHGCSVDPAKDRSPWNGYAATEGNYVEDEMGG